MIPGTRVADAGSMIRFARSTALLPIALLFAFGACEQHPDGTRMPTERTPGNPIPAPHHAVCILRPVGDSGVTGLVNFWNMENGVRVVGKVTGLTPGKHGFHVHEYGDLRDTATGKSAGGHFNPENAPHGARTAEQRHVGDLGNIEANDQGVAEFDFRDQRIAMNGGHSILGRGLVVHAKEDDFGQPTGNAGARVAFGVIGVADPAESPSAESSGK